MPLVLHAGLLPCCKAVGLKPRLGMITPFSPWLSPFTAITSQTAQMFPHSSRGPWACGASRGLLLLEASGPTCLLGFSSTGDLCFLACDRFLPWVRLPGQKERDSSFILPCCLGTYCMVPALCTGTVVSTLISWGALGEA